MDTVIRAVIEAIHGSPTHTVLYLSGGASQALGWLLSVPGASSTVLEATVPYSRASMVQLLGKAPAQSVCRETAEAIAMAAYNRALKLSMPGMPVAGIGFTGALASVRPKRGEHRCYLSARTQTGLWHYDLNLAKGYRDRFGEDLVTSRLVLKSLADVCGVPLEVPLDLEKSERLGEAKWSYSEEEQLQQLLNDQICMIPFASIRDVPTWGIRRVVLSGSFNPLHDGHLKLLDTACRYKLTRCSDVVKADYQSGLSEVLFRPVMREGGLSCFEISAINADKPPLGLTDVKDRVRQFDALGKAVIITNQPYFYKKAELFPDSTFVVGVDTAIRLLDPKYYGDSKVRMLEVLLGIHQLGCDFLVAGRKVDGRFKVLGDVDVPNDVQQMFQAVPEELFHSDLSSTQLRQRGDRGASAPST